MTYGAEKLKLGIFILSSIALLIVLLMFFGWSDFFKKKIRIVSFYSESVQGLNEGSAVKYRGVPIGSVSKISIDFDDRIVRVEMDVGLENFKTLSQKNVVENFKHALEDNYSQGLRSSLEYAGVTGLRYVNLDYYGKPGPYPSMPFENYNLDGAIYVPAMPSMLKDIISSLNVSLERISRIRFEEIFDTLANNLSDINKFFSSSELKDINAHIKNIALNLDEVTSTITKVVTEERLDDLSKKVDLALFEITELSNKISKTIDESEISNTVQAIRITSDEVSESARIFGDNKENIAVTIDKLNRTLDSVRELVEYLNQDPSAVISGRKEPSKK